MKYPNFNDESLNDFRKKYPGVFERQFKIANLRSTNDCDQVIWLTFGEIRAPLAIPERIGGSLAVKCGAHTLSVAGFACVTLCLTLSYLWADIEFKDFDFYKDILKSYKKNRTPVSQQIDFDQLKEDIAQLHHDATLYYRRLPECAAIELILD